MRPLFSADSVGKAFGARSVLKAASVWAVPGRVTVLLGRNGCGKSTLLRIGAGVLPLDTGVVHFDGVHELRPRLHRLAARGLFYLPDCGLLSPRRTLRDHVDAVRWRFPGDVARADAIGDETAEAAAGLAVDELLDRRVRTLSVGERRRGEIALALVRRPRCLLADEPLAGIAPLDVERVARALRRLARADARRNDQFRREYLGAAG